MDKTDRRPWNLYVLHMGSIYFVSRRDFQLLRGGQRNDIIKQTINFIQQVIRWKQ